VLAHLLLLSIAFGSPAQAVAANESGSREPLSIGGAVWGKQSDDEHAPLGLHAAVVAIANARGVICSGTLIAKRSVLTARHCLPATRVHFGPDAAHPVEVRSVIDAVTPLKLPLDVAILHLDRDVETKPYRWRRRMDSSAPVGDVRLIGYGRRDAASTGDAGVRRYFDARVEGWGCDSQRAYTAGCREDAEMLIPRRAGHDTCSGDSGGPVVEANEGTVRVIAVVSRSVSDAFLACGDGGIYTRTDVISAWIEENAR
jgi:hypothetical protein